MKMFSKLITIVVVFCLLSDMIAAKKKDKESKIKISKGVHKTEDEDDFKRISMLVKLKTTWQKAWCADRNDEAGETKCNENTRPNEEYIKLE
jgi:hypothetical protein